MLSLKARDITKIVVIAIIAALLCLFSLPYISILPEKAVGAIVKAWDADHHARLLTIIEVTYPITFGISGFLMGVLIGFVLKSNRMLTTILALLIVTIVVAICSLDPYIPQECKIAVLIRLYLSFLLEMVFFWGCAFLGVWLVSRRKRKIGQ